MNGVEKENTLTPQEHHNAVKLMNVDTSIPEEAPPSRMPQEPRREGYMKPARSAAQPMLLNEISGKKCVAFILQSFPHIHITSRS